MKRTGIVVGVATLGWPDLRRQPALGRPRHRGLRRPPGGVDHRRSRMVNLKFVIMNYTKWKHFGRRPELSYQAYDKQTRATTS